LYLTADRGLPGVEPVVVVAWDVGFGALGARQPRPEAGFAGREASRGRVRTTVREGGTWGEP
jgi:hypothetical protein